MENPTPSSCAPSEGRSSEYSKGFTDGMKYALDHNYLEIEAEIAKREMDEAVPEPTQEAKEVDKPKPSLPPYCTGFTMTVDKPIEYDFVKSPTCSIELDGQIYHGCRLISTGLDNHLELTNQGEAPHSSRPPTYTMTFETDEHPISAVLNEIMAHKSMPRGILLGRSKNAKRQPKKGRRAPPRRVRKR